MPDYRAAAGVVEDALGMLVDAGAVRTLRPDSPLTAVGLGPVDAVCLADAIASAVQRTWGPAPLFDVGDHDLADVRTVDDLVRAVLGCLTAAEAGEQRDEEAGR
jgi:hypothetical protein